MDRLALNSGRGLACKEFVQRVYFYTPTIKRYQTVEYRNKTYPFFVPVSVTGKRCLLNCQHCRGILLESMYTATSPAKLYQLALKLEKEGCQGMLISGGADLNGEVPLVRFLSVLARIKKELGFKIAVHTGLVSQKLADGLAEAGVDVAMIDIIGDDETIRKVYHLDASVEDYECSLKYLVERGVKTSPHVVIGLHYGRLVGEEHALRIISRYKIASLVLVVLNPLSNTPMANVTPPSPHKVYNIFLQARMMFPEVPILLGCARPGGRYRLIIDKYALQAGLNGIAYPAEGVVSYAKKMGLESTFSEWCCSLIFEEFKEV
ncbi:radical SAM protein [Candidatus Aerophobetes bacterium]|uniref:Radical SAM protein n=1 Tax=Aerophobetes bacterium TaxID=2030807 RepID=A0A662DAZ0_UNCAE|nr:MAG: radical SAM protein [Candidatus Aerophobetes bacterium]